MPRLSVVILTLNEEAAIGPCLQALGSQTVQDIEVILVDAASTDRTLDVAREAARALSTPLRIHADERLLPIGEARNLGARMAKAPFVAYLSADAELDPRWVEEALRSVEDADMAFGQQVHMPHHWSVPAAVRGLRYHFPSNGTADALPFASNVAGVYRTEILHRFPFDEDANAAEDLVVAKQAIDAGYRAVYNPAMIVSHHDVATHREEMRKNVREGRGWGEYRHRLGWSPAWIAWGAGLTACAIWAARRPVGVAAFAGMLWAPALRRAMKRRGHIPPGYLAKGVAASPIYDVAFLANYVVGAMRPRKETP